MIIVAGTLRIPEERIEELMPVARATVAATRREAGCIVYSFAFDIADRGLMRIYEEWESRAHLDAHGKQPHMKPWREALALAGVSRASLRVYETDEGEPL